MTNTGENTERTTKAPLLMREVAAELEVTVQAVHLWVQAGCPAIRTRPYLLDLDAVMAWRAANVRRREVATYLCFTPGRLGVWTIGVFRQRDGLFAVKYTSEREALRRATYLHGHLGQQGRHDRRGRFRLSPGEVHWLLQALRRGDVPALPQPEAS